MDAHPELTGDTIPKEVLESLKHGKDINDSYEHHLMKTENESLKEKITKLESEIKAEKQKIGRAHV